MYDLRELQVLDTMEHEGVNGSGPNNLDKERNMVNDDPKWQGGCITKKTIVDCIKLQSSLHYGCRKLFDNHN